MDPTAASSRTVKSILGVDKRRFDVPVGCPLSSLLVSLRRNYGLPASARLMVRYRDIDGDWITLGSDDDLLYAFKLILGVLVLQVEVYDGVPQNIPSVDILPVMRAMMSDPVIQHHISIMVGQVLQTHVDSFVKVLMDAEASEPKQSHKQIEAPVNATQVSLPASTSIAVPAPIPSVEVAPVVLDTSAALAPTNNVPPKEDTKLAPKQFFSLSSFSTPSSSDDFELEAVSGSDSEPESDGGKDISLTKEQLNHQQLQLVEELQISQSHLHLAHVELKSSPANATSHQSVPDASATNKDASSESVITAPVMPLQSEAPAIPTNATTPQVIQHPLTPPQAPQQQISPATTQSLEAPSASTTTASTPAPTTSSTPPGNTTQGTQSKRPVHKADDFDDFQIVCDSPKPRIVSTQPAAAPASSAPTNQNTTTGHPSSNAPTNPHLPIHTTAPLFPSHLSSPSGNTTNEPPVANVISFLKSAINKPKKATTISLPPATPNPPINTAISSSIGSKSTTTTTTTTPPQSVQNSTPPPKPKKPETTASVGTVQPRPAIVTDSKSSVNDDEDLSNFLSDIGADTDKFKALLS
ncbi:hypothetical protein Pelo_10128 [Pelomyxa schiedti]|nr:hypothetical protein Pelo_10128 [Pelomyxa schiedti]